MGPPVTPAGALPGAPRRATPGAAHGVDIDENGDGTADYQRTYQLVRQPPPIGDRRFEIEFLDAGVEVVRVHLRMTKEP